jgi:hypothetical protein
VILNPSKYPADGCVERVRPGFMPDNTVPYLRSMTPTGLGGTQVEVHTIDEYDQTELGYLSLLRRPRGGRTLRYCAWRRTDPRSGAVVPVLRDRVDGFLALRKDAFGFELVSPPRSLQLPAADSLLNGGHQSACAGEFATRNRPLPPSLIRSSSRDPIGCEPGIDSRSNGWPFPRDGQLAQRLSPRAIPACD